MYKWYFLFKHLSLVDFIKLTNYRFSKRFGIDKNDRQYVMFKFLEEQSKKREVIHSDEKMMIVTNKIAGQNFQIHLRKYSSDPLVYNQILVNGEFDFIKKEIEKRKLPMHYMIDGGANIGLASIYFKSHFANIKIAAFEPNHANAEVFKKNMSLNQLPDISLYEKGLWNARVNLIQDENPQLHLEWGYSFKEMDNQESSNSLIEGITIEESLEILHWPKIDYLKIDIEGAEKKLFETESLCIGFLNKTQVLSVEAHDFEIAQLINKILVNNNFEVHYPGELIVAFKKSSL